MAQQGGFFRNIGESLSRLGNSIRSSIGEVLGRVPGRQRRQPSTVEQQEPIRQRRWYEPEPQPEYPEEEVEELPVQPDEPFYYPETPIQEPQYQDIRRPFDTDIVEIENYDGDIIQLSFEDWLEIAKRPGAQNIEEFGVDSISIMHQLDEEGYLTPEDWDDWRDAYGQNAA